MSRVSAEYGDVVHFRLGPFHVYLLNHPDDIEQVLVTHHHRFAKGRSLSGARRLFGNGLLTSDAALHARQRRLVQPALHRARLDDYSGVMTALGAERRDAWKDGDIVDIAREMSHLTLAITSRILFGAEGDDIAAEIGDSLEAATSLLEVAMLPFAALTDLLPLPHVRRFRAARATLDRVVNDRHRTKAASMATVAAMSFRSCYRHGMRRPASECLTARFATRSSRCFWRATRPPRTRWPGRGICWPAILPPPCDLHAEIDAVLGEGRLPRAVDVPDLRYTRMVLAESMRLYPPAWLLARVAVEDHDVRGYVIPKGSFVVLSPWVVHRSSAYFVDPEQFEPERWRAERHDGHPRFSYFPFGGGTRGCMGEAFAWMEGVLLVAIIAQRWRFRLLDESRHPEILPF